MKSAFARAARLFLPAPALLLLLPAALALLGVETASAQEPPPQITTLEMRSSAARSEVASTRADNDRQLVIREGTSDALEFRVCRARRVFTQVSIGIGYDVLETGAPLDRYYGEDTTFLNILTIPRGNDCSGWFNFARSDMPGGGDGSIDDNDIDDADSTLTFRLTESPYPLDSGNIRVVLQDDDFGVGLRTNLTPDGQGRFSLKEGAGDLLVTIVPETAPSVTLTVPVELFGGDDFGTPSETRTVTITPDDTSVTLTLTPQNDTMDEQDSTLTVTIQRGSDYTLSRQNRSQIEVALQDDEIGIWLAHWQQPNVREMVREEGQALDIGVFVESPGLAQNAHNRNPDYEPPEAWSLFTDRLIGINARNTRSGRWSIRVTNNRPGVQPDEVVLLTAGSWSNGVPSWRGPLTVTIRDPQYQGAWIEAASTDVTEGPEASVDFTVRLTKAAGSGGLSIPVSLSGGGDFGISDHIRTFIVSEGETARTLSLTINNDNDHHPTATFTATLQPPETGAGYELHNLQPTSVTVTIRDDDIDDGAPAPGGGGPQELQEVSIRTLTPEVDEGGNAEFEVWVTDVTLSAITVTIDLVGADAFQVELPRRQEVVIRAGASSTRLIVRIGEDDLRQENDRLYADIVAGEGYLVPSNYYDSVLLRNNDHPREVTIRARSPTVPENGTAEFDVRVEEAWPNPFTVNLWYRGSAWLFGGDSRADSVIFPADATTTVFMLRIPDNSTRDEPGFVEVEIDGGADYRRGDPGTARVVVLDDDGPPSVTIQPRSPEVIEGMEAVFDLRLGKATSTRLTVMVELSGGEDFGVSARTVPVEFDPDETTASLPVSTMNDRMDEPDGELRAHIVPDPTRYTIEGDFARVMLRDNDIFVSLTPRKAVVAEGDAVEIDLAVRDGDDVPAGGLVVDVQLSGGGAFGIRNGTEHVTIAAGMTTALLSLRTDHDRMDEPDATLTATVVGVSGYDRDQISTSTVEVLLQDIDLPPDPEVTIRALTSEVTEGGNAQFEVRASYVPLSPVRVNVAISGAGDFGVMATTTRVMIGTDAATEILSVPTTNTPEDEPNDDLVAEVVSGMGYTLSAPRTAVVTILDDESVVTLEGANAVIAEGETVTFTAMADEALKRAAEVRLEVMPGAGATPQDYRTAAATIAVGSSSVVLTLEALEDMEAEAAETLQVSLSVSGGAVLGDTPRSYLIAILNTEPQPMSGESVAGEVSDGGASAFRVRPEGAVLISNETGERVDIRQGAADGDAVVLEVADGGAAATEAFAGARIHLPASLLDDGDAASDDGVGFEVMLSADTPAIDAAEASRNFPFGFNAPAGGVQAFDITVARRDGMALAAGQRIDICLPSDEMEVETPAVFRFDGSAWRALEDSSVVAEGLVCGATHEFSAHAVLYGVEDPGGMATGVAITTAPYHHDRTDPPPAFGPGEVVEFTITFSEAMQLASDAGTPALAFRIGGADRTADFAWVNGTEVVFHYEVESGDSGDISLASDALQRPHALTESDGIAFADDLPALTAGAVVAVDGNGAGFPIEFLLQPGRATAVSEGVFVPFVPDYGDANNPGKALSESVRNRPASIEAVFFTRENEVDDIFLHTYRLTPDSEVSPSDFAPSTRNVCNHLIRNGGDDVLLQVALDLRWTVPRVGNTHHDELVTNTALLGNIRLLSCQFRHDGEVEGRENVRMELEFSRAEGNEPAAARHIIRSRPLPVWDVDRARVEVGSSAGATVQEGATIEFPITLSAPVSWDLYVDWEMTFPEAGGGGVAPASIADFVSGPFRGTAHFPPGETRVTLSFEVVEENTDENPDNDDPEAAEERFELRLLGVYEDEAASEAVRRECATSVGSDNTVNLDPCAYLGRSSVGVTIREYDGPPRAWIQRFVEEVTEGEDENVRFLVRLYDSPSSALTVNVALKGGEEFGVPVSEEARFGAGATIFLLSVPIIDDNLNDADGVLRAEIVPATEYAVGTGPSVATTTIMDDDPPREITIEARVPEPPEGEPAGVEEGENAEFELRIDEAVAIALTVNVAISGAGNFGVVATTTQAVFDPNAATTSLRVMTMDDEVDEPHRHVRAEVVAGSRYYVPAEPRVAHVLILDNEGPPPVEIHELTPTVTEGGEARFELRLGRATSTESIVEVALSGDERFGVRTETRREVFEANATTTFFTVDTTGDDLDEPDGTLRAAIVPNEAEYTLIEHSVATVAIADDDEPREVSIQALDSKVIEDGKARFELSMGDLPLSVALSVDVRLTGGERFGVPATTTQAVFDPGATTTPLIVSTKGDERDELNGLLEARVVAGAGYIPGENPAATLTIEDDDYLGVWIAAASNAVTEGVDSAVELTLTADEAPGEAITIHVDLAGGGDFGISGMATSTTLQADATSAVLSLPIDDDDVSDAFATLTATIVVANGYTPHETLPARVEVTLADDDIRVWVTASSTVAAEGEDRAVALMVTAGEAPGVPLIVQVDLSDGDDFGIGSGREAFIIAGNATSTTRLFDIDDDRVDDLKGTLTATIVEGARYIAVGDPATVNLRDDDILVSITPSSTEVIEGQQVGLTFGLRGAATRALTVEVQLAGGEAFFETWEPTRTVTIDAGTSTAFLSLTTDNDENNDEDATLVITILGVNGYDADQIQPSTVSVTLLDNDIPVSVAPASDEVMEGGEVVLVVTAGEIPAEPLVVDIGLSGGGDFGIEDMATSTTIAGGATSTELSLRVENDNIDDVAGTLTATVLASPRYAVSGAPATVQLLDDDILVSLTPSAPTVTEGMSFEIELTVRDAPDEALVVEVQLEGGEHFFETWEATRTATIAANATSTPPLSFDTHEDMADDEPALLTATVSEVSGYEANRIQPSTAQISLQDNDLWVSLSAPDAFVEEGDANVITVRLEHSVPEALVVRVGLEGAGDYGIEDGPQTVTVAAGTTTALLILEIDDDATDDADTMLTAMVEDGVGYVHDERSHLTPRPLTDTDIEVSIAAASDEVTEGDAVVFTVSASSPPPSGLSVNLGLMVNDGLPAGGDFGLVSTTTRVTIRAGDDEGMLHLATTPDVFDEPDGNVTAMVLSGLGYVAGATSSATVALRDDDLEPVVTIHALEDEVIEDGAARFEVRATYVSLTAFSVEVRVSGAETFEVAQETRTLEFSGTSTAPVVVQTMGDIRDERGGIITAEVLPGTGYRLGAMSTDQVHVRDDDGPPEIEIRAVTASVKEGTDAEFEVRATYAPLTPLRVMVTLSEVEGFGVSATTTRVALDAGATTTVLSVETREDDKHEPDDTLEAQVVAGTGYDVGAPSFAAVTIEDDDAPPAVTIHALTTSVNEGEVAQFEVRASYAPLASISVQVELRGGDDFGVAATTTPVTLDAGATTAPLPVQTMDDDLGAAQGTLRAQIVAGPGYVPGEPPFDTVTLMDNEPVVMLQGSDATILEGETVTFTAVADRALARAAEVRLEWTGGAEITAEDARAAPMTIAAGNTSAVLTLEALADTETEAAETLQVRLSVSGGATSAIPPRSYSVTIINVKSLVSGEPVAGAVPDGASDAFAVRPQGTVLIENSAGEAVSIAQGVVPGEAAVLEVTDSGGAFAGARVELPASLLGDGVVFEAALSADTPAIDTAEASSALPFGVIAPAGGVAAFDIEVARRDGLALAGDQRIDICLPFDETVEGAPGVFRFAGGAWRVLDNSSATGEGLVCGATREFSAFAVLYALADPGLGVIALATSTAPQAGGTAWGPMEVVLLAVTFSEAVQVAADAPPPALEIQVGGERRTALYAWSDSETVLIFSYGIASEDSGAITVPIDAFRNPGAIATLAGDSFDGTLPAALEVGTVDRNLEAPIQLIVRHYRTVSGGAEGEILFRPGEEVAGEGTRRFSESEVSEGTNLTTLDAHAVYTDSGIQAYVRGYRLAPVSEASLADMSDRSPSCAGEHLSGDGSALAGYFPRPDFESNLSEPQSFSYEAAIQCQTAADGLVEGLETIVWEVEYAYSQDENAPSHAVRSVPTRMYDSQRDRTQVTLNPSASEVMEGQTFQASIQLGRPAAFDLYVPWETTFPAGSGGVGAASVADFASGPLSGVARIPAGETQVTLSFEVLDESTDDNPGNDAAEPPAGEQFRVSLLAVFENPELDAVVREECVTNIASNNVVTLGSCVTLGSARAADVAIREYDGPPRALIRALAASATEGTDTHARFRVRLYDAPSDTLTVTVALSGAEDFRAPETEREVEFAAGTTTALLTVAIIDDRLNDPDERVLQAEIVANGTDYVRVDPFVATVAIADDDPPLEVTISAPASVAFEGEKAEFELEVLIDEALSIPLTVNVAITSRGDFGVVATTTPVVIAANTTVRTLFVETRNDEVDEPHGHVRAEIVAGGRYYVPAERPGERAAQVTILDNEGPPAVGIRALPDTVIEGGVARFGLGLGRATSTESIVLVAITSRGDFGVVATTTRVVFAPGQTEAPLPVQTKGDEVDEPDGEIRAEIVPSPDEYERLIPVATVTIRDDDYLGVSIAAASSAVTEGVENAVELTLTAAETSEESLAIRVELAGGGDFGIGDVATTTMQPGATTATLSLPIVDDDASDAYAILTATVVESYGYSPHRELPTSTEVTIADDDIPVSVTASAAEATEGMDDAVLLTVAAGEAPGVAITVQVELFGGDDFGIGSGRKAFVIDGSATSTTRSFDIADDSEDDVDGTLTATVIAGARHVVSGVPATVSLRDDDILVSVTASSTEVTEGQPVELTFEVRDAPEPGETLAVQVQFAGGEDFFKTWEATRTVIFDEGESTVTRRFSTADNHVNDEDMTLVVTIMGVDGYDADQVSSSTVSVTLRDNDIPVSVTASSTEVTEGGEVALVVTALEQPDETLTVGIELAVTGEFEIKDGVGLRTVTIEAHATAAPLTLTVLNDRVDDVDGTLTATVVTEAKHVASGAPATVNLRDDDILVTLTPSAPTVTEGESFEVEFTVRDAVSTTTVVWLEFAGGDDFDIPSGRRGVTFDAGDTRVSRPLTPMDDRRDDEDATLTLTVIEVSGYDADQVSSSTVSVTLRDNDIPVSVTASSTEVTEGGEVVLVVAALEEPDETLMVGIELAVTGEFEIKDGVGLRTVTIEALATTTTLTLTVLNDRVDDVDGTLTATVVTEAKHVASGDPATVNLRDDDILVTLTPVSRMVTEGQPVEFDLSVRDAPDADIEVTVELFGGRAFGIADGPRTETIDAGTTTALLSLSTDNDVVNDEDAELTATVVGVSGHETNQISPSTASVRLLDDDLLVSVTASSTEVTEGSQVILIVEADEAPGERLVVGLDIDIDGDFELEESAYTVTFEPSATTTTLSLTVRDDRVDEENGTLTAAVIQSTRHIADGEPATVRLRDNDLRVWLNAAPQFVEEGPTQTHIIAVQLEHDLSEELVVRIQLSGGADYGVEDGPYTVTVTAGETLGALPLDIDNDTTDDADTTLVATVLDGDDYVYDENSHITRPLVDGDIEVSITASSTDVTEGAPVVFTVSASSPPPSALAVNVALAVNDGLAAGGDYGLVSTTTSVTIDVGTETTLMRATADDRFDEAAGNVTATVLAGDGYVPGATSSATVLIHDNDEPPEVSIHALEDAVNEGNNARFEVRSNYAPTSPVDVEVAVGASEGFGVTSPATRTVRLSGTTSAPLIVSTADDTRDEADGEVIARIVPQSHYTPVEPFDATVRIVDDDAPPVVTIHALAGEVIEGEDAPFEVRATYGPTAPISVEVSLTGGDRFGVSATTTRVVIDTDATSTPLVVRTAHDTRDEANGTLVATLVSGGNGSARIEILDDDELGVSIAAASTDVREGVDRAVALTVTAAASQSEDLPVRVDIAGGAAFGIGDGVRTVTIAAGETATTTLLAMDDDDVRDSLAMLTARVVTADGYTAHATLSSVEVTIRDDDLPVTIAPAAASVTEGEDAAVALTVATEEAPGEALTVSVSVEGGTDFGIEDKAHTVTIDAAATTTVLSLDITDDNIDDMHGTLMATVDPGSAYAVGGAPATVRLRDDDIAVLLALSTGEVTEEAPIGILVGVRDTSTAPIEVELDITGGDDFGIESRVYTVTIAAGSFGENLSLPTENDAVDDADSTLTVTVIAVSGYDPDQIFPVSTSQALVDDDILVSLMPSARTVTEGKSIEIGFAVREAVSATTTVQVEFSGGADFGILNETRRVMIGAGATSTSEMLTIVNDRVDRENATLTITIVEVSGYRASQISTSSVTITLVDDDILVSLTPLSGTVTEGKPVEIELAVRDAPAESTVVWLALAGGSDFGIGDVASTTIQAGRTSGMLSLDTENDLVVEEDATLTATVTMVSGYDADQISPASTSVMLLDDDLEVSVAASSTPVAEGGEVVLVVEASEAPGERLVVELEVVIDGTFELEEPTRTVTIEPAATTATLSLTLADDSVDDVDGTLTATVISGTRHVPHGAPASVKLVDDDILVSLTPASRTVTEGAPVEIVLTVRDAPDEDLVVEVEVSGGDAFDIAGGPRTETIAAGTTTALLSLDTENDLEVEENAELTATVTMVTGYESGQISSSTASVTLLDDDLQVWVVASSTPVAEGEAVVLIVTASEAPGEPLVVELNVVIDGTFELEEPARTVTIEADATMAILSLTVADDLVDDAPGTLTATVISGTRHVAHGEAAEVTLTDDDIEVSIAASSTDVTEGSPVMFTVSASSPVRASLTVNIDLTVNDGLTDGGDFGLVSGPDTVTIEAGDTEGVLTLDTENDRFHEPGGNVTATVGSGAGYVPGATSSATVTIRDNDPAPEVTIHALTSEAREYTDAEFELRVNATSSAPVSVTVALIVVGDFEVTPTLRTVVFNTGASTTTLPVSIPGDGMHEPDGSLTAEIVAAAGYVRANPYTAEVALLDDDLPPSVVLSIAPAMQTLEEGTDLVFTLSLDWAVEETVTVEWQMLAGGADDDGRQDTEGRYARDQVLITRTADIEAGATSTMVAFRIPDDNISEGDEVGRIRIATTTDTVTFEGTDTTASLALGVAEVEFTVLANDPLTVALESPRDEFLVADGERTYTVKLTDGEGNDLVGASEVCVAFELQGPAVGGGFTVTSTALYDAAGCAEENRVDSIEDQGGTTVFWVKVETCDFATLPQGESCEMNSATFTLQAHDEGAGESLMLQVMGATGGQREGESPAPELSGEALSLPILATDPLDVNGDRAVDANDALILYYSYSLRSVLGTGR